MKEKIEILITTTEYLKKLKFGIESIVKYIEEGNEIKACEFINKVAEGMEWVVDVIMYNENLINLSKQREQLKVISIEIVEGLQNEDYILVGDLFNYEINPIILDIEKKILEFLNGKL